MKNSNESNIPHVLNSSMPDHWEKSKSIINQTGENRVQINARLNLSHQIHDAAGFVSRHERNQI